MENPKNILICEDHPIYAKGLEDFLKKSFNVLGCYNTSEDVLLFLKNNRNSCDFLILDLNLSDSSGLTVLEEIKKRNITVKVIVLSMYNDKLLVEKCKNLLLSSIIKKSLVK